MLVESLFDGPLDVVGDVQGEIGALRSLMQHLGYDRDGQHPDRWNVGRHIEVAPHYRRPHMTTLGWAGQGRAAPKIVPRRGSVVHREAVEKVPSGFGRGDTKVFARITL